MFGGAVSGQSALWFSAAHVMSDRCQNRAQRCFKLTSPAAVTVLPPHVVLKPCDEPRYQNHARHPLICPHTFCITNMLLCAELRGDAEVGQGAETVIPAIPIKPRC